MSWADWLVTAYAIAIALFGNWDWWGRRKMKEDEEQACTIVAILSGIWTELDSLNTLVGAMVVLNFVAVIAMIILGAMVVGSLWQ